MSIKPLILLVSAVSLLILSACNSKGNATSAATASKMLPSQP